MYKFSYNEFSRLIAENRRLRKELDEAYKENVQLKIKLKSTTREGVRIWNSQG